MKVQRGDLVLSTQGRSFWILDDLEPLRQMTSRISARSTLLFAPGQSWRIRYRSGFGGAEQNRGATADPEYPPAGAMIDYWLPQNSGPVTIEIVNDGGDIVRRLSSEAAHADSSRRVSPETGSQRLTRVAGVNRIVWDMQYPGPWDSNARRNGRGGPVAPPGTYTVKLIANGVTQNQMLVIRADPRVGADGVTVAVMRAQLAHNLRVRDLVSEVNRAALRVSNLRKRSGTSPSGSALRQQVDALDRILITPPVRYSRPGLQAQIQYLYGAATDADQEVGRDAIARYAELKKELEAVLKQLDAAERLVR
jgi:hypothetical protein